MTDVSSKERAADLETLEREVTVISRVFVACVVLAVVGAVAAWAFPRAGVVGWTIAVVQSVLVSRFLPR